MSSDTAPARRWGIGKARPSERAQVLELVRQVVEVAHRDLGSPAQHQSWLKGMDERYRERLEQGAVWVGRQDDRVIGCGYLDLERENLHRCDAYVGGLYVSEPGQGLGSALLEALLVAAQQSGRQRALMEVAEPNQRWVRYLLRRGFGQQGKHPGRNYTGTSWLEMVLELNGGEA